MSIANVRVEYSHDSNPLPGFTVISAGLRVKVEEGLRQCETGACFPTGMLEIKYFVGTKAEVEAIAATAGVPSFMLERTPKNGAVKVGTLYPPPTEECASVIAALHKEVENLPERLRFSAHESVRKLIFYEEDVFVERGED